MSQLATLLLCVYTLFFSIAYTWEHLSESDLESMLKNNEAAAVVAFINPSDKKTKYLETEWSLALPEAKVSFVSIDYTANAAICALHMESLHLQL